MPFMTNKKKQLLKVLILATALIPIYVIFMAIFQEGLAGLSIFTSIYSTMMIGIWTLYYFDAFDKNPTINNTNGKLALNNEETLKPN